MRCPCFFVLTHSHPNPYPYPLVYTSPPRDVCFSSKRQIFSVFPRRFPHSGHVPAIPPPSCPCVPQPPFSTPYRLRSAQTLPYPAVAAIPPTHCPCPSPRTPLLSTSFTPIIHASNPPSPSVSYKTLRPSSTHPSPPTPTHSHLHIPSLPPLSSSTPPHTTTHSQWPSSPLSPPPSAPVSPAPRSAPPPPRSRPAFPWLTSPRPCRSWIPPRQSPRTCPATLASTPSTSLPTSTSSSYRRLRSSTAAFACLPSWVFSLPRSTPSPSMPELPSSPSTVMTGVSPPAP